MIKPRWSRNLVYLKKIGIQNDNNIKIQKYPKFILDKDKSNNILFTRENSFYLYDYNKNKIIREIEQKIYLLFIWFFIW